MKLHSDRIIGINNWITNNWKRHVIFFLEKYFRYCVYIQVSSTIKAYLCTRIHSYMYNSAYIHHGVHQEDLKQDTLMVMVIKT